MRMRDNGNPEYASTITCYGRVYDSGTTTYAVANDDFVKTTTGATVLVSVAYGDICACAPVVVEGPGGGTLSDFMCGDGGYFCYYTPAITPAPGFHGVDTFTYKYPAIPDQLHESRTATVKIAVEPVVVELDVAGEFEEGIYRRAIVPENVDWHEEALLGGSRLADDLHDGIVADDARLRTATLRLTNNFPCEVTGYWSMFFRVVSFDYGGIARAYRQVGDQWHEVITEQEVMVSIPAGQTIETPLLIEGISSQDIDLIANFHVVNIADEILQGGLRSVAETSDTVGLKVRNVDLAVGPWQHAMPEVYEDDLPMVVAMNRDYDMGYVDGQGQPLPDCTNPLPDGATPPPAGAEEDDLVSAWLTLPNYAHGT
ncbi:MAG: hypothetical protein K8R46_07935, partial [Pirellulales bacterium]|nr:hypothetical protein [Pirellulales bacterium]